MGREPTNGTHTVREFVVARDQASTRVDLFLVSVLAPLSRSKIRRLIEDKAIWLNGTPTRPGTRLREGDVLQVELPQSVETSLRPWNVPLDVVYEDADVAVVNKPPGMVVHPAAGHTDDTLVNALLARYPELTAQAVDDGWPGIVHRLDKDTSGLILVARNDHARQFLQRQFRQREVEKTYLALIVGRLEPALGRIEAPIARHRRQRKQMTVRIDGREAQTAYRVRQYFDRYSLIEARPETGRTHQIRVHLAAIGHPVAGDRVYGRGQKPPAGLARQFLHAWKISFRRPSDKAAVALTAELAPDLQAVLEELEGRKLP